MRLKPTIIIEAEDRLSRRVIGFDLIEHKLVLAVDRDEHRPTRRHGWRTAAKWHRFLQRNNTMPRREIPEQAIEEALKQVRDSITYED